ncbi:MAG: tungstate ABC transporter substrate-binding protein WtpA [Bacteroidetes bacterium CG23_combo_of_CG06-09_8_20_14_all_32_9]|nr:MAG: tungstate ABC transporter substrate-binding protein WtpA [Bacteroidetes bacterium CG23_combo_of_CG06-09_8_20_14_all_32_9]
MKRTVRMLITISVAVALISCGENGKQNKKPGNENTTSGDLTIFHAGSLAVPVKEIIKEFNKEYPNIKVLPEAAGSVECARKISELKKPCDVFASADVNVIAQYLFPDYADWSIKFASNEMVIAYNEKSRKSSEINKDNWYNILLNNKVAFGRADPDADPCGYRSVLVIKLAEKYYSKKGLAGRLLKKDVRHIRPKEVDLLALLESNSIDYIFIYKSVVEQHKLKYVMLPDEVNLKNPKMDSLYATVSLEVKGKKPGEIKIQKGEAMIYGITIPKNAPNMKAALAFVEFFLNKSKGMKIMGANGQPSVIPSYSSCYNKIPDKLKSFAKK